MSKLKIFKSVAVLGLASVMGVSGFYFTKVQAACPAVPADCAVASTNASLTVTAGTLNMYAGDATNNNDLCIGTDGSASFLQDDGTSTVAVTCASAESAVSFSNLAVSSSRQSTSTTTINDILFEDLSGSVDNTYSVAATFGNLVNGSGGSNISLGANPDGATDETGVDANAPTSADAGKLYCVIDPSVGTVAGIAPGAARAETAFSRGPLATITATGGTGTNIFSTTVDVYPGRYDLDAATYYCRVPAYLDAGSYSQAVTFTVTAS